MFYQLTHPASSDYCVVERGSNFSFPPHMHQCFEFIYSRFGTMNVVIDGVEHPIDEGEAVLIFPNQIHSLTSTDNEHILCIFSPRLVEDFYRKTSDKKPVSNKFRPTDEVIKCLEVLSDSSRFAKKGYLYLLSDCFHRDREYTDSGVPCDVKLLTRIFLFIEKHYADSCSLADLADHLKYDYSYLSRYFKRLVGVSFNSYVNNYRLNRVCNLLSTTDKTVLDCAIECGFKSVRNFNRNFKSEFGMSPTEYKNASRL